MPVSNPFTPKSGWEPKVFVGREKEIEFFKKKLEQARAGRCDHFLVLGDWGVGKTSLLKRFKEIAQEERILTSLVTINEFQESSTFLDGVKVLLEQIPRKLPIDTGRLRSFVKQINTLGIQVLTFGFNFARSMEGLQPQTLLLSALLTLWQDLKGETEVVVVLLDDVQNFSTISGIFTLLKNVLSDEEMVQGTKFLFGLSCTPEGWTEFLQRHHPIGRYFTPRLHLNRLTKEKTFESLDRILVDTGVAFDEEIKRLVHVYTEGHPYELQVLCSHLYDNQVGGKVTEEVWATSFNTALVELGEIIFDYLYQKASPQEMKVLYLFSLLGKPMTRKESQEFIHSYPLLELTENTVNTAINRLLSKGLLVRRSKFKYSLFDHFFLEYVKGIKGLDGEGRKIKSSRSSKKGEI